MGVSVFLLTFFYRCNMDKPVYNKNSFKTTIGGQALIEGVLMRGPSKIAIAVRKPDHHIVLKVDDIQSLDEKYPILKIPFLRGAYKLIDSMVVGINALTYSASFYEETEEINHNGSFLSKIIKDETKRKNIETGLTVFVSFIIAALLFMVFPSVSAGFFAKKISQPIILNLMEGVLRLLIFAIYLYYISKLEDIKRVFQYHGSEHKSIHCYEAGEELTVENVKKYPIEHPRCGTSFLFMVMIISILVLSLFGWPSPLLRVVSRVVALPIIAGVAYEVNRIIGKHDGAFCRLLQIPGLKIQRYATVIEPDDEQIEVAIASLKAVLPQEGESDLW